MPPRSKPQGESKQGLIITLVFFILSTLGLGVSTYYGYEGQDKLDKAAKEAANKEKSMKDDRDYYKAQAMVFRGYMGLTEGMDGADTLGTLKKQLEDGTLGKGSKDKENVTKVLETLKSKYGWTDGNQPKETLEDAIKKLDTDYKNLANRNQKTEDDLAKAKKEIQRKEEELQIAQKDFADKLQKLKADLTKEFNDSVKDIKDFRAEVDRMSQQLKDTKENADKEKEALKKTIAAKEKDIRDLKKLVQKKDDEIAEFRLKNPLAPPSMRTDWRIVKIDARGLNPYINLGSADRVKQQLTFTIHSLGLDGRPNPVPKGTLEVVEVIGPHLSRARVTSLKDANADPVIENDVIYNASWNPNIKKHVAVAGIIDLTGSGRDSLFEFMRNLERQNIIVDAYLDPKDGSTKGHLSYQTDYLILGGDPEQKGSAPLTEAQQRMIEGKKQLQDEAKKYGAQPVGLLRYLESIGYPLPPAAGAEKSLYKREYRSDLVPHLSRERFPPPRGGEKTPPPMPPNK